MIEFRPFAVRLIAALSVGLVAAAGATAAGQGASATNAGEMRLKLTTVMDPTGFEKPMAAARTVIPADWTTKGGVIWRVNGGDCNTGQSVDWTATSADGKAMIRMLPSASWQFNNQGLPIGRGCIPAAFTSSDQYVNGFISQLTNAKITGVERDKQTTDFLSQYPFYTEMPGDPYMKTWWDAASVSFTYDQGGEEYTAAMIVFSMHNYTVSGHSYGFGAPMEMGYGMAMNQILLAAPTDEFAKHVPAFLLFLKNYQVDPEWQARMNKHSAKMSKDAIETSKKISGIISSTYSDISDKSMISWRKQNESSDYLQRETSEMIRGVETFDADTPTGQIELPSGYDRAFQLNDDTFVVTNDAFYEPFRDSGIEGRELNVTQ
ncbi:MAG: hypothetical protein KDA53_00495 [Hyphomonas sp.]|nr:hypothetical protein [Hyphomonas sp.]